MADYSLSRRADDDIADIANYTIENSGLEQARRYRDGLERCFQMLAKHPLRGRSAEDLAPSLRRLKYESHVIFYLPHHGGVLIARVLHQRMDFESHSMED